MMSSVTNDSESTNSASRPRGQAIVISPHADDAAYSIGGLIQKSIFKSQIHIVTLFGRSNFLRKSGFESDWRSVTSLRQREDTAFATRVGVGLTYFNFPEAGLRLGPGQVFSANTRQGTVAIPGKLTTKARALFDRLRPRCLFAPLAIGGHYDHLIARQLAATEARKRKLPLFYYEDLPYVAYLSPQELIAHTRSVDPKLRAAYVPIDLKAKLNNLTLYRSQITGEELQIVSRYTVRLSDDQPAERLWSAASQLELLRILQLPHALS
jgi:LmbE family N-acetylglucosaminyl deacetylase